MNALFLVAVLAAGGGSWKQLGKAEFGGTQHLAGIGSKLYTIESSGSLYEVTP